MNSLAPIGRTIRSITIHIVVSGVGFAFWKMAQVVADANEVWDTPWFLPSYGAALGLSAAFGLLFPKGAWRWGLIVVFAQFPAMMINAPPAIGANMWPVGLIFTAFLALPGAAASAAAAQLRQWRAPS